MNAWSMRSLCLILIWTAGMASGIAADWPMYKHDAHRSGVTDESFAAAAASK